MHRYSPSHRPLSAIATACALAFAGLGFVFAASPASAAATVTLTSSPTTVEVGSTWVTTAFVEGSTGNSGVVNFLIYGPDDATCTGTPTEVRIANTVRSNGTEVAEEEFTAPAVGTFRIKVSYSTEISGDARITDCNAPGSVVTAVESTQKQDVTLTTQVSDASITLGESVTDTATITAPANGPKPTGNFGFAVYGPDDTDCTGEPIPLGGGVIDPNSDTVTSSAFTPTEPGTYRFRASYHGDDNYNLLIADCNEPNESVVVSADGASTKRDITVTTHVSDASITLGESVTDTITLTPPTGGPKPTGNVGFAVYGPDDATCETAIPMGVKSIDPNSDTVTSDPFTPTEPGTYRWVGSYHGDDNYNTHLADCNEPNETVVVTDEDPGLRPGPDEDEDGDRVGDGDEDGDGDGDEDENDEDEGDEDEGDEDEGDEDEGDEGGDLPDTGAQGSPFLLGLGLVLTTAGYIISWRHRPGQSR